jgi:hypothetical protein
LSPIINVKEYLNLQYLITNIIIRYSEIIIENNYKRYNKEDVVQYLIINIKIKYSEISIQIHYKYYNKEKSILILNHITNIKIYLTFFVAVNLTSRHKKWAGNILYLLLIWVGTKKHNIGVGPLKWLILKITLIFSIGRLKTAATNNLLLISAGKPTIISIDSCC